MDAHSIAGHTEQLTTLRRDVDDHEVRLRAVELVSTRREEQVRGLYENVGAIKELIAQQTAKLETMVSTFETKIQESLKDIDDRLKTLETADGKKWQQAVWVVFSLVAGAVAGSIFR